MLKLTDILKESKVGHLVEKKGDNKPKSKFKARSKETGELRYFTDKEKMDKAIKAGTVEPLDKKDKKGDTKKSNVDFKKDDKPASKKDQEKAQKAADKKAKKELDWDKQQAGEDPFGEDDMFGFDDDDDFDMDDDFGDAKTDDYGQKLSKSGDKRQQQALELKLGVGVGQLTKVKTEPNHRVTNKDGNPVQVAVFQDPETKKYYGITDEGDIYESDSGDFRNIKEPTTDARGFDGAVTAKGQAMMDMRIGKGGKEDEYDSTSFADLLDLLGLDTDIDYTNPFAAD